MNIQLDDFWDENYYNHPTLTPAMIESAENTLGVTLPKLLTKLLYIQNGGYTKLFKFPLTHKTSLGENYITLTELFGIVTDKSLETAQNILSSEYMTKEWGLPDSQVLLSGDGHWWITLDYRCSKDPAVTWIDTEINEEFKIACSFEEFINGLELFES